MGDPRKTRKKYQRPSHPWQKVRIDAEKVLKKDYGVRNKKELWKMQSKLRQYKIQAKKLIAASGKQSEMEKQQLMKKLQRIGLVTATARLDDILGLNLKDIMDRRLQTVIVKKNLARSVNQARQFIVHNHISISGKKITSPSYLVNVDEEPHVTFSPVSSLSKAGHPERIVPGKKPEPEKETVKQE